MTDLELIEEFCKQTKDKLGFESIIIKDDYTHQTYVNLGNSKDLNLFFDNDGNLLKRR